MTSSNLQLRSMIECIYPLAKITYTLTSPPPYSEHFLGATWETVSWTLSSVQFSSVQSLSCVQLFATPWTAARQASLSITNSQSLPKHMSMESVMPSSHLILCHPLLSCPQSLPASGSFPMSQLLASGGQVLEFQLQHQSFQWTPRTDFL